MATDNETIADRLGDLAARRGVVVAKRLDAAHAARIQRLSHLSGATFDRSYARHEVNELQRTLRLYRREVDRGSAHNVIDFAYRTERILRNHLHMAESLAATGRLPVLSNAGPIGTSQP
jgi:putative membrane protein